MKPTHPLFKVSLLSAAIAFSGQALAQETQIEELTVTGFKGSLQSATLAKRDSTAMVESVFAEDIGKFPDFNVAESIGRIPGIQLTRDVNGDGMQVAIRGLGTNFTKVMLNGNQISVASAGSPDSQNQNREVDLNLFPTELFTRIDVHKTQSASLLEGGLSGVVNMRNARPFDTKDEGWSSTYQAQAGYSEINEKISPRVALTTSWRDDTFGVLFGLAAHNNKSTVEGYETIGWSNLNLTNICGDAGLSCDSIGGNNINIPGTVPVGVGNGLQEGRVIDAAYLQELNPNVDMAQLSDGLLPRLSRPAHMEGDRDRTSALVALEYRPTDNLNFYLDSLYTKVERDFNRLDVNWVGRFGSVIPIGMEVDSNNVVTKGTFANAQFFIEARPYHEDLDFYNINPGGSWENDVHRVDFQANISRSDFTREAPTILLNTPMGQGITVDYTNQGGDFPQVNPIGVDLNDPNAGWVWAGGRLNIQNEVRKTTTDGVHIDYRFGDDANNIKVGVAWDNISRRISARDNSGRWEDVACRGGLDENGDSPEVGRLPCDGLSPEAAIPQSELASYIKPGPGMVTIDYDRFFKATNYAYLNKNAPEGDSSATSAKTGFIEEDVLGAYVELNQRGEIAGHPFTINAGVRWVDTDQTIQGPVTVAGERSYQVLKSDYAQFLPSINTSFDVTEDVKVRVSASRTLTRANPSAMLPATTFSDPSAIDASQGNPNLSPYLSTNFDIGGEWYTGDEGYVGLVFFQKDVTGFTVNGLTEMPFERLGIPYDSLTDLQKGAIDLSGGPSAHKVLVSQQVNASGNLDLKGYELSWVQPLDMVFEGLGFSANYTNIKQKGKGEGAPAQAIGVAPESYSVTGYWENYGASLRLSYTWYDQHLSSGPNQNGISFAQIKTDARGQLDLSASYQFEGVATEPMVTLNISNLTSEPLRSTFWYDNATFNYYNAGYTATLGIRGTF